MALVVGDKVLTRLETSIAAGVGPLNPQPPSFGVVVSVDGSGDVVVLSQEGQIVPPTGDMPQAAFWQVTDAIQALKDAFLNKIVLPRRADDTAVTPGTLYSQEYTSRVVDIVSILTTDLQPLQVGTFALCRTLNGPMWLWVRVSGNPFKDPEVLTDR